VETIGEPLQAHRGAGTDLLGNSRFAWIALGQVRQIIWTETLPHETLRDHLSCGGSQIDGRRAQSGRISFSEGIENSQLGTVEILVISGHDRQPVPPCCRGNVAVFNRHSLACVLQKVLLFGPDVSD
jgi:hypothetical protein